MPIFGQDDFQPAAPPAIRVALEPALNVFQSLMMLVKQDQLSGLPEWVYRTYQTMSEVERQNNALVVIGLHYAVAPRESWNSFPAYIDYLSRANPVMLRDRMIDIYDEMPPEGVAEGEVIHRQQALQSEENYIRYLQQRFCAGSVDEEIEARAYHYVIDPPAMQKLIVEHLWNMWGKYLKDEWERTRPMLQEVVRAYRQVDFRHMTQSEAVRLITGHEDIPGTWAKRLGPNQRVIFVPNPHTGPYVSKAYIQDAGEETLVAFFGARLPRELATNTPEISRAEMVTRLNALADDTRLGILRLIAERGELRSQDIIQLLELSQSAASRHLSQLSATGYLIERRCDGAKCYALNPERIQDTLNAIASFLMIEERSVL